MKTSETEILAMNGNGIHTIEELEREIVRANGFFCQDGVDADFLVCLLPAEIRSERTEDREALKRAIRAITFASVGCQDELARLLGWRETWKEQAPQYRRMIEIVKGRRSIPRAPGEGIIKAILEARSRASFLLEVLDRCRKLLANID